ncbi:hypothetical protein [Sorangium sp. So ce1000]|uniref:hypothetical protein n=1 Tax=Sorangium sp. So ce1000 TaxID=3133325 RepID=UPI003F61F421
MRGARVMSGAARRERPERRGRGWRRAVLGALALGALASPAIAPGCVAGFDPPSLVSGLRVFAVVADVVDAEGEASGSYAHPGAQVTFKIHYQDGLGGPEDASRPVNVYWFGGCENPAGDDYYGCYEQLEGVASELQAWLERPNPKGPLPTLNGVPPGFGDTYTITIGKDILSGREPPTTGGPAYGSAFVFFVACTGELGRVKDQGTGRAGTFPIACFSGGRRLGPDSFVPGYTQIYVFEDGRRNANPEAQGLTLVTLDGEPLPEDVAGIPTVPRCRVSAEERRETGCSAEDPFVECTAYELDAIVDPDVAENDPSAQHKALKEIVWVDYFADLGDLDGSVKLVSDASKGYLDDHAVKWIPPAEPGVATLTAVLRDARGGSSVVQRLVRVE